MARQLLGFLMFSMLCMPAAAVSEQPLRCAWDTCVPASVFVGRNEVPLKSLVPFRYWGFKVYVAALYVPDTVQNVPAELGAYPLHLVLYYYRGFTAPEFIASAEQTLAKNPAVDLQTLRDRLGRMNRHYRDVSAGDSYALEFDPESGLTLLSNGTAQVTISGADFARAYLGIWLSPYSISSSLTESLLGNNKG